MKSTWKPHEKHGKLTMKSDLPDTVFAFPEQRKEPLTDAKHVRNAAARFDQVTGVSDDDRALAFVNIEKAAKYYDVDLAETNWHELGVHAQPHRKVTAREGARTRVRTGESKSAARKAVKTKAAHGILKSEAQKGAKTRRKKASDR